MLKSYAYRWQLRPALDLRIEVEVIAPNVATARRIIEHFLAEHGGADWALEAVARTIARPQTEGLYGAVSQHFIALERHSLRGPARIGPRS